MASAGLQLSRSKTYFLLYFRYTEVLPGLAKQLVTHVKNENKYKREVVSSIEPFEAVIHLGIQSKKHDISTLTNILLFLQN